MNLHIFRELPNPQLELFDLDDAFSSEKARLAQITNKCGEEDVEYFVRESADILGITADQVPALGPGGGVGPEVAKHILEYVFAHVVEFKKLNSGDSTNAAAAAAAAVAAAENDFDEPYMDQ